MCIKALTDFWEKFGRVSPEKWLKNQKIRAQNSSNMMSPTALASCLHIREIQTVPISDPVTMHKP